MACKTTWTSGKGQEYMFWNNVETKPWGSYPLAWDVRILQMLGPQRWEDGVYQGKTIFEAAPPGERVLGYLPEDLDYAYPNRGEDETNAPWARTSSTSASPMTSGSSICPASATTALIPLAWRPAHG